MRVSRPHTTFDRRSPRATLAVAGLPTSLFYTNLTCLNYHADFSSSRYCPATRSTPEIPPDRPADRSVSRYEKRSKCAGRPRTTLTILRPHRRGRNGGRVPFRSRLRAFKWRPCSSTDRPAGFQRWWRSSGRSEKPNDPPGKPAGFVCNNEVSRPRTTFDRRSPRATACANSGRPPVAPTAGSGDPRRRCRETRPSAGLQGQRLVLIQGDLRSRPRRGRETRAERCRETRAARRGRETRAAPSGDPRRALSGGPCRGLCPSLAC